MKWTSRLVWDAEKRGYTGRVDICGFPYTVFIERDWSTDQQAVKIAVEVWDGPAKNARDQVKM
jgi:hypothetical protein